MSEVFVTVSVGDIVLLNNQIVEVGVVEWRLEGEVSATFWLWLAS